MSRKLSDLDPIVERMAWRLIAAVPLIMERELFVVHTLRTYEEQNELYKQGRSKPGKIITKARGGESFHNWGLAIDVAFEEDGTQHPIWETTNDELYYWELLGKIGESIGFEWGGRYRLKDYGHFHYSGGQSKEEIRNAYEQDQEGWKLNA